MTDNSAGPLAGVKVVDFGIFAAGPFCSMILGDLGADVIRVEPVAGEPLRGYFRGYASVNRGKRVIALDMKAPEARAIVDQLCAQADVVHHNYRPGVSARLGIDAATLRAKKADTIVLEAPGYGVSGPKINEPAFDMVLQGYAGHEGRFGGQGNFPLWYRLSFVDLAGGMLGAMAVTQALFRKARTGEGAGLTVSLLDAAIFLLSELVQDSSGRFSGADMLNSEQTGFHPAKSLYRTKDGWVALVLPDEAGARLLAERLSLTDRLSAPLARWDEAERQALAQKIGGLSTADVLGLRAPNIWIEPCRKNAEEELFAHPVMRSLGTSFTNPHPRFGELTQLGPVVSFSRTKADLTRRGYVAGPGGDTRSILADFGYSEAQIDDYYARKIVA